MKYIEAPNCVDLTNPPKSIFLAGSISKSWDWQKYITPKINDHVTVVNPRRSTVFDPKDEQEQISWEYLYLNQCYQVLFWFSHETVAPITLFEFGWLLSYPVPKQLYIGIDPAYVRKNDVLIQTELRNPQLASQIVFSLDDLAKQVINANS